MYDNKVSEKKPNIINECSETWKDQLKYMVQNKIGEKERDYYKNL